MNCLKEMENENRALKGVYGDTYGLYPHNGDSHGKDHGR